VTLVRCIIDVSVYIMSIGDNSSSYLYRIQDAVMHMYTHDRLWPRLADLAAEIGSKCHLLASLSGGHPFDEVMSCPWASLQDSFPDYGIPMACESVTIELRGERDVSDAYAVKDAHGLFTFLQRRGYVAEDSNGLPPLPSLIRPASPLDGVDMIEVSYTLT